VIQRGLQNKLAELILAGRIQDGSRVAISAGDGALAIGVPAAS